MSEEGLTTIIHRDRHGTVKNTRTLSVMLTSDLGDSDVLSMSQRGVTDNINRIDAAFSEQAAAIEKMRSDIDSIIAGNASASLTSSKPVVNKGVETAVKLTAQCMPDADEIVIMQGTRVVATGTGAKLEATEIVNTQVDITYKAIFTVSGNPREVSMTIRAVSPIFYGCGIRETDATTNAGLKQSVAGTYTIQVPVNHMYIYFVVPASMTGIRTAVEGGVITFPLSAPTDTTRVVAGATVNYKVYQSNELDAGTYIITLT